MKDQACFSPRNGEVILKTRFYVDIERGGMFQSPQWGSNSKEGTFYAVKNVLAFQSPQWGSNSKVLKEDVLCNTHLFQSPQWGSNSKVSEKSYDG